MNWSGDGQERVVTGGTPVLVRDAGHYTHGDLDTVWDAGRCSHVGEDVEASRHVGASQACAGLRGLLRGAQGVVAVAPTHPPQMLLEGSSPEVGHGTRRWIELGHSGGVHAIPARAGIRLCSAEGEAAGSWPILHAILGRMAGGLGVNERTEAGRELQHVEAVGDLVVVEGVESGLLGVGVAEMPDWLLW